MFKLFPYSERVFTRCFVNTVMHNATGTSPLWLSAQLIDKKEWLEALKEWLFSSSASWQESPISWPASSPSYISRFCSWRPSLRRRWLSCSAWRGFAATLSMWRWCCTSCGSCWSRPAKALSYVSVKHSHFFFFYGDGQKLRFILETSFFLLSSLFSESGAWGPSHGSPPQFYPAAHVIHTQVWVHRSPRSPAVFLLLTVCTFVHWCNGYLRLEADVSHV